MDTDRKRAESAMSEFLRALGHDFSSIEETAARVTSAYIDELLSGYNVDIADLVRQGSELAVGEVDPICVDEIHTATVCPHHLLVAQGQALVAYVPGTRILGLGTLTRLVDACSRRLVLQEQIAQNIVDALMTHGQARGAFCRLTFDHACLQARGAGQPRAQAITWARRGELLDINTLSIVLGRDFRGDGA